MKSKAKPVSELFESTSLKSLTDLRYDRRKNPADVIADLKSKEFTHKSIYSPHLSDGKIIVKVHFSGTGKWSEEKRFYFYKGEYKKYTEVVKELNLNFKDKKPISIVEIRELQSGKNNSLTL